MEMNESPATIRFKEGAQRLMDDLRMRMVENIRTTGEPCLNAWTAIKVLEDIYPFLKDRPRG